jgi:hypothetical protein
MTFRYHHVRTAFAALALLVVLFATMMLAPASSLAQAPRPTRSLQVQQEILGATKAEIILPQYHSVIPEANPVPRFSCGLRVDEESHQGYCLRTPQPASRLGKTSAATINVNFNGSEWTTGDGPAAQAAFLRAAATWEALLDSPITIEVDASFATLGSGVLGSAGACSFWFVGPGFDTPSGRVLMGSALTDAVTGDDQDPGECDIQANFSNAVATWNFGPGAPSGGEIDFESVVLHELGHGLDFMGILYFDDGADSSECEGVSGTGCQWFQMIDPDDTPEIWNYFVEDDAANSLLDTATFPENSAQLGSASQGDFNNDTVYDGNLLWNGTSGVTQNGGSPPELYSPGAFDAGSSFSHLDDAVYNGTLEALMTHAISNGEMQRSAGPVTCGMMEDQLWDINVAGCGASLPVELIAFEATSHGEEVVLNWATATEDNNSGFEIEHRDAAGTFETVGFVPGAGRSVEVQHYDYALTGLTVGEHTFRLKQIDYDGTAAYSYEVELLIQVPEGFVLYEAYPNPFNPATTISFAVGAEQRVVVEVYNSLGRRVALLHDGVLAANQTHRFAFEAGTLPSGLYVYRVTGPAFSVAKTALLLK